MAFVKKIDQNSTDSHQTSPSYMLTCIRWRNRDTYYYDDDNLAVRETMVVVNDAISVTTTCDKRGVTTSMSATLKAGDINYATALAPGDFIFLNMVNDKTKIWAGNPNDNTLKSRALKGKPINKYEDGFKGLFKVQSCRKTLIVEPNTEVGK